MSFLHITNQTEESADINLFSRIHDGSGQSFVNELNFLDSLGLNEIRVRINSKGGDVFEGFGIVSAIRNAKTKIITINEGIAASTAGWILAVGDERRAVDFSQTMTHNPSIDAKNVSEADKSMLAKIKQSLITIFTNNTGLDAEKVDELMNRTTFMTAKEALKNGIIDSIISTKRKIENSMSPNDLLDLVNNNFEETPKTETMKLISNHLNLNSESNESTVLNAIKDNEKVANEKFETEENAHKETKTTLESVQNELKTLKTDAIEKSVDNAIEDGKVKKEDREKMIKVATESPEAFNMILEAVETPRQKIGATIDNSASAIDEAKKEWSIRDYEKKDPTALNEMRLNDFENYSKLFEAHYKVVPTK